MLKHKLRSTKGETITEVLVSSLVIALGALMLASMVTSAMRLVQRSDQAYQRYMDERNTLAERAMETSGAYTFEQSAEATVQISLSSAAGLSGGSEKVNLYQIKEDGTGVMATYEAN